MGVCALCGNGEPHSPRSKFCRERQRERELFEAEQRGAAAARASAEAENVRLRSRVLVLSRVIRRAIACGQLEKLADAMPYLDET